MNIEIANRLVELRKANNLSQEALAEKLGISRQAVSKWERAEASPDTDNLILLARLYQISLDELLKTDEEIIIRKEQEETDSVYEGNIETENEQSDEEDTDKEYVHVGLKGVHVKDKDGEVHVGWDGIHVLDYKDDDEVHITKDGIYVNDEDMEDHIFKHHKPDFIDFPLGLLVLILYIVIGCVYNLWHPGWLIFLLLPIIKSAIRAFQKRKASCFNYPVLVVLVYLHIGFVKTLWHPGWVLFLTIPLYYEMIHFVRGRKRE